MDTNRVELVAGLVSGLVWPAVVVVLVFVFREQIGLLIRGIREFRVGGIEVQLKRLNEKVSEVESATRNLSVDIYRVSGDALRVREEIWQYVAEILDKSTDSTKFEMRKALTERHLPNIGMTVPQAKQILFRRGFLEKGEGQRKDFSEEITPAFLQAVYDFQQANDFAYADGIIGPKTSARLKQQSNLDEFSESSGQDRGQEIGRPG